MNLIIDFYKELDTINLIIFWGTILVIFLLLTFAIIIANKNKKLKRIIVSKEHEIEKSKDELAIKQNIINEKEETIINNTQNNDVYIARPIIKEELTEKEEININETETDKTYLTSPIKQQVTPEKNIANNIQNNEVYLMPPINEEKETKEELTKDIPEREEFIVEEYVKPNKEITIPNTPYQRNVLREMSLGQTSPIGITRKEPNPQREILNKEENHTTIQNIEILEDSLPSKTYKNTYQEEMNNSKKMINKLYEEEKKVNQEVTKHNNYLQEVSKKLEESKNDIERTAYEIKQEEDAIISYEELMKKKDTLKIEDEEDAIISIEELKRRKAEQERIYNITKEEEDNKFINELKDFRSDL